MPKIWDAIVVGGGPAGSSAARVFAEKGLSVLLIDREKFPRIKPCAGGLTNKDLQALPECISRVIERQVKKLTFTRKFKDFFAKESDDVLISCVSRNMFDHFLVREAEKAGAVFNDNTKLIGLSENPEKNLVEMITSAGKYNARVCIGADGPASQVSHALGLNKGHGGNGLALEAELYVDDNTLDKYCNAVHMDAGTFPGGYGWIFPKSKHLSVGVGGPAKLAKYLEQYFHEFVEQMDINVKVVRSYRFHSLPVRAAGSQLVSPRTLLAGDAAGLTDPLSGEGIYYAVKSGKLAAETAIKFLDNKIPDLSEYQSAIESRFQPDFKTAADLRAMFNTFPRLCHTFAQKNQRAWEAVVKLMDGRKPYAEFKKALGAAKFTWPVIAEVCKLSETWKVKRFKM